MEITDESTQISLKLNEVEPGTVVTINNSELRILVLNRSSMHLDKSIPVVDLESMTMMSYKRDAIVKKKYYSSLTLKDF